MTTKYHWQKTISNVYLGKTKVIRGLTRADVNQRAAVQLNQWAQQEAQQKAKLRDQLNKQAQQDYLLALQEQAEQDTNAAQQRLSALQELLRGGLHQHAHFTWNSLKQLTPYPAFHFNEPPPTLEYFKEHMGVPAVRSFRESLFSGQKAKREELEAQAQHAYEAALIAYAQRKAEAQRLFEQQKAQYEKGRDEYNASIDQRRRQLEQGDPETMVWFITRILNELALPEEYGKDFEIHFEQISGTAEIDLQLPTLDEVPRIVGYKFIKSRKAIDPVEMKPKEFDAFYDSLIHQIALLVMHFIFQEVPVPSLQSLVFNGWVTGIDKKTGNDFDACIISVQAARSAFAALHLERVDPKECVRNMRGLVAGPLAQLAPVKPIMELNREDSRFIASREILGTLDSFENLAQMDWEDFEHLVRELFEREFGNDGAEVRITQASRDRGVDAIVFDPDPIRGGKYVIQAKRYNNVVPVAAVRELYGTMISEGAVKGILVTTSHFGNDAREFAKDKPISLIDGANLVYLFQKHGYQVTIEIQK